MCSLAKTNVDLSELLAKHDQGDLLRSIAEAVLQLIMEADVEGLIGAGRTADLLVFRARTFSELLSRPQSDRTVLRAGVPLEAKVPDYRELDDLFA